MSPAHATSPTSAVAAKPGSSSPSRAASVAWARTRSSSSQPPENTHAPARSRPASVRPRRRSSSASTGASTEAWPTRAGSAWRGGAGSSTTPPPTVVSRREHDAVAARSDERPGQTQLRLSPAHAHDPRRHGPRPVADLTRAPSGTSPSSAMSSRKLSGYAPGSTSASPRSHLPAPLGRDRDRDALARCRRLDRLAVHLHAAHADLEATGQHLEPVAGADLARPERPGHDRAGAGEAEDPVDVEARRRRRPRGRPLAARSSAARSSSSPSPVTALTRTTSAPGTRPPSVRHPVGSTASIFVSATTPRSTPSRRRISRCSSVCARGPSPASTTSRKRSMPVAPATIVRTKRSWPGTSITDSRRPLGRSSGA